MIRIPTLFASLAACLACAVAAEGQTSAPGIILTLASQVSGSITSTDQTNLVSAPAILTCSFAQSAHSGSPSTTFKIQSLDEALGVDYVDVIASAAVTSDHSPAVLTVGPGLSPVANSIANVPVPAQWRVAATVGGSATPISSAQIHCRIQ